MQKALCALRHFGRSVLPKTSSGGFAGALLIMKFTAMLLLVACLQVSASGYSQKVSLSKKKATLENVFKAIKSQTGYSFFFDESLLKKSNKVTIEVSQVSLKDALDLCFKDQPLTYSIIGTTIVLKEKKEEVEKVETEKIPVRIEVRGKVTDQSGNPLVGASVNVKGSNTGTSTDANGNFSIEVPDGNAVLVISFVGYETLELAASKAGSANIVLKVEEIKIEEVVVTALGIKRQEKALGYATQKVSGEKMQTTKGAYIATSLTGKIAGLWVKNSTEFNEAPSITLRGGSPLLVIDGVPYSNMTLRDIAADNIETIDVIKGAAATALYGTRAGSGALMITTKNGKGSKGLSVNVNSNNMVAAGFLSLPETQTSYGHGLNGVIDDDYVWGPKLDIGNTAMQWNPETKQLEDMPLVSSGKNNFKNFLETSIITNNNISISQSGENGSFRASLNHIYHKGQYPNLKLNTVNFSVAGEVKATDKFNLEAYMGYNREMAPQTVGSGYGDQGYIYQILMWTGPDYDIRQYKDYWLVKDQSQNWMYNAWYDNPYYIAYEKIKGQWRNKANANLTASYKLFSGAKLLMRHGFDGYSNEYITRNPINTYGDRGGFLPQGRFATENQTGYSINSDLIFTVNKKVFKDFGIDALAGGTIYRYTDKGISASTANGLIIPGYYSLKNSKDPLTASSFIRRRQDNSLYAKATFSYKSLAFVDVTGRNDWVSTQDKETRSFFYPSAGASLVLSELFTRPTWLDFWRVRGSWTQAKRPLGIYDNNKAYITGVANWDGMQLADYPNTLIGAMVEAQSTRTFELGTAAYFLKNRAKLDFAYYNNLFYNRQANATLSPTTGFTGTLINIKEEIVRRGFDVTLEGSVVKKQNFQYDISANWGQFFDYYHKLDPVYSAKNPWTEEGGRIDAYPDRYWRTDPNGNIIHSAGFPLVSSSNHRKIWGYTSPKFIWGLANKISWRQFEFNFNFDGRVGGMMYNYTEAKMWDTGSHPDSDNEDRYNEVVNGEKYVGEGVKVVSGDVEYDQFGNITKDTRVFAPNDVQVSYQQYARRGLENRGNVIGTFVKLRDASIGYRLSPSIANKIGARAVSVSLTGQNLLLWTKEVRFADPDKGTDSDLTSPSVRYIGMNINVTF